MQAVHWRWRVLTLYTLHTAPSPPSLNVRGYARILMPNSMRDVVGLVSWKGGANSHILQHSKVHAHGSAPMHGYCELPPGSVEIDR